MTLPAAPFQRSIPWLPSSGPLERPLPGIRPLNMSDWLLRDEAFAGQMALKDWLVDHRTDEVLATTHGAKDAIAELLRHCRAALDPGYEVAGDVILRPDGITIDLSTLAPLTALARLTQADHCLLAPNAAGEWVLRAAAVCFPASWCLSEKIGRPLDGIHAPVERYTADMAARVDRLFAGIRSDAPLWRYNLLVYDRPEIFTPRVEADPRATPTALRRRYVRSERQVMRRLPETGWVVFSIHTALVRIDDLTAVQRAELL